MKICNKLFSVDPLDNSAHAKPGRHRKHNGVKPITSAVAAELSFGASLNHV